MSERELHVIFGAGPVAMAVMEELRVQGRRIRMVSRSGKIEAPENVEVSSGDASDLETAGKLCEGAAVVYNCACPPYDKWPELFPELQNGIMVGAANAGAKLMSMENLDMYGSPRGKALTEALPYDALTRKGMVRARMAEELMTAHEGGRVSVVCARASDFFGPRARLSAMGERVFNPALKGRKVRVLGNPDLAHTFTYIADIGRALVILGQRDEALGQIWHIPSPETGTTREFIEAVFDEAGHKPRIQTMSRLMVKTIGLFQPIMREREEMLYLWEEPFVVDHSKFETAFGFKATPLREAIKETLDWYRANPKTV
jgi:nucleoside-diphosphate-sugar epimerase